MYYDVDGSSFYLPFCSFSLFQVSLGICLNGPYEFASYFLILHKFCGVDVP